MGNETHNFKPIYLKSKFAVNFSNLNKKLTDQNFVKDFIDKCFYYR